MMNVPARAIRTGNIVSNRFWDETAYVLGVTLGETARDIKRAAEKHDDFKATHAALLAKTQDEGLLALQRFLEIWMPAQFEDNPHFIEEMKDANIVFRVDGVQEYIHDRPAARALLTTELHPSLVSESDCLCLVTGKLGRGAKLHPPIKGVRNGQTQGASLVNINLDAFTSYGKEQGSNAPMSEAATARYSAALNRMLDKGSRNRIQVGDTTTVFWADASGARTEAADAADAWALYALEPRTDREEAGKVKDQLAAVTKGLPAAELSTEDIDPAPASTSSALPPTRAAFRCGSGTTARSANWNVASVNTGRIWRLCRHPGSGHHRLVQLFGLTAPPSQELEPPANPGRFITDWHTTNLAANCDFGDCC